MYRLSKLKITISGILIIIKLIMYSYITIMKILRQNYSELETRWVAWTYYTPNSRGGSRNFRMVGLYD